MTALCSVTQRPSTSTPAPQAPAREAVPGPAAQASAPLAACDAASRDGARPAGPAGSLPDSAALPATLAPAPPGCWCWRAGCSAVTTFVIMLTGNPILLLTVLVGAATIPVTVLLLAQSTRSGPVVPGRIVLVTVAASGLFGICSGRLEVSGSRARRARRRLDPAGRGDR